MKIRRRTLLTLAGTLLQPISVVHSHAPDTDTAGPQQVVVKLFGAGLGSLDSYGTGVLVTAEGHVLTVASHLVSAGFLTAVTSDGKRYAAETVATEPALDAALLKLKADPSDQFPCIDLKSSLDPEPGTPVLAWSNMFRVAAGNEPVSVVHGVIAASVPLEAVQGKWKFPLQSRVWLIDAITNNSGAAGGLLTDASGTPVGLIGREIRHAISGTWVNYAVPLTTLRPAVEAMLEGRKLANSQPQRNEPALSARELTARFGLALMPAVLERTPAWVDAVIPGSAAAVAGIRRGDLIVLIGDAVITSESDARRRLADYRPGQKIAVTLSRNEQLLELSLMVTAPTTDNR